MTKKAKISLEDFVPLAIRTEAHPMQTLVRWESEMEFARGTRPAPSLAGKVDPVRLIHVALGLQTEIAELEFEETDDETGRLREESGDIFWYCGIGRDALKGYRSLLQGRHAHLSVEDRKEVLSFYDGTEVRDLRVLRQLSGLFSEHAKAYLFYGRVRTKSGIEIPSILLEALCGIEDTLESMLERAGLDGGEVRAAVISKLRKRYPDKFTEEDANARADKEEEEA